MKYGGVNGARRCRTGASQRGRRRAVNSSVESPRAASDVVSTERLVTPATACDVPETRAAAPAGGGRRAARARRAVAEPGARAGRGPRGRALRARARGPAPRLPPDPPLPRPGGRRRPPPPAALLRPALLQPLPLQPPLRARYV